MRRSFVFALSSAATSTVNVAVSMGFRAWGLLALSMCGIFLVVLILNKLGKRKDSNDRES